MLEFFLNHPYVTIWITLAVLFERALYLGYVVDDREHFNYMQDLKKELKGKTSFRFKLGFLYNSLYGAGFFKNGFNEHLFTVILHGVNCSLIYNMSGSLLGAILYLINPVNNQTTLWLNGRRYAVSILGVLIAWNCWWTAPFIALFCTWFHVSAIAMPVLFLATPFWAFLPVLSAFGVFLNRNSIFDKMFARKKDFIDSNENQKITWKKLILYVKSIGFNLFHCIFPHKPSMYHDFLYGFGHTEEANKKGYALNFDFYKGLVACAIIGYTFTTEYAFWAFWFVVFISQWCNLYQVTMNSADRYCSLPNIGVMITLAGFISKLPSPYSHIVYTGFAVFYIMKYIPLFRAYIDLDTFHKYHIDLDPEAVSSRFFLSKIYVARKDAHSAFALIKEGLKYKPYDFKLLLMFIECMIHMGKIQQALRAMDYTEKYIPIGEEEDCKKLFESVRRANWKTYMRMQGKTPDGKNIIHNNGKPVRNNDSGGFNKK